MFENSPDFYPTPAKLIERMLSGIDFRQIESVLEPSAGKGDLAARIGERMNHANHRWNKDQNFEELDLDTVEIQPDLRHVLIGKGLRVVHDDFLSLQTLKRYDLIAMNPPFSDGCKHLLKALQMQARGGTIVCLLNAETLKNPCTNDRKELARQLTERGAKVEFIQDAFRDAERKTDVEVALIKVEIPEQPAGSSLLEALRLEARPEPEISPEYGALIDGDFIKGIVRQYEFEVRAGLKLIDEYEAMRPYILNGFPEEGGGVDAAPALRLTVNGKDAIGNIANHFIRAIRRKYWEALFKNQQFTGLLTFNLQQDYFNRVSELCGYDFSPFNIYSIRCDMSARMARGVENTILDLFEEFSHKHYWDKDTSQNIHYYNGWKTNSAYKVNPKVIIPLAGFQDLDYSWGDIRYDYRVRRKLEDIEKVFNYLDGGITREVDLGRALDRAQAHGMSKRIQLKYFRVTFYKKGTCHIEYDHPELLKKFNIFGSRRKGWLPPSYGKKAYRDMDADEKAAVDGFEGVREYEKTMSDPAYYLFSAENGKLFGTAVA